MWGSWSKSKTAAELTETRDKFHCHTAFPVVRIRPDGMHYAVIHGGR